MRRFLAVLPLVLFAACQGHSAQSSSDCAVAVRAGNITFVEAGIVSGPARSYGEAEYASCDDNGENPRGAYFPDDPRMVRVWSFAGHDSQKVVGIRVTGQKLRVLVAEGEDSENLVGAVRESQRRESASTEAGGTSAPSPESPR